jgi:hypothetical protein
VYSHLVRDTLKKAVDDVWFENKNGNGFMLKRKIKALKTQVRKDFYNENIKRGC